MDWLKHSTGSHDDPDISDAMDEFGDAGYAVFFIILEIYGQEFNSLDHDENLDVSKAFVRRKLRKSWTKAEQILSFYQTRQRIFFTTTKHRIKFKVPKYIEISSNWVRRNSRKPPEAPPEAPTAIEVEEEVEEDKETTPPVGGHFSNIVGNHFESIKSACEAISKLPQKHPFNSYQWVQAQIKNKQHPGAVNETLQAILKGWSNIETTPWQYASSIIKTKSQNWNEREAVEAHKKLKSMTHDELLTITFGMIKSV